MRQLLGDAGVELRALESPEDAETERFLGSPTLRIGGCDVEPGADSRSDFGLKCRIYRGPAGASPLPPDEWILDALSGQPGAAA